MAALSNNIQWIKENLWATRDKHVSIKAHQAARYMYLLDAIPTLLQLILWLFHGSICIFMNSHHLVLIRESTNNNFNVSDPDLVCSYFRNSNGVVSYRTKSSLTVIKHKETSSSAPKSRSTGPTLIREKGISSILLGKTLEILEILAAAWAPQIKPK